MSEEARQNREKIDSIKLRLSLGQISYLEAKIEARPIIESINTKSKELAQKYKTRPKLVTFTELMR